MHGVIIILFMISNVCNIYLCQSNVRWSSISFSIPVPQIEQSLICYYKLYCLIFDNTTLNQKILIKQFYYKKITKTIKDAYRW